MHWLIDNALIVYVLLGLFALGFLLLYRNNRDRRSLIGLFSVVGAGVLVWSLTLFVVTDRQQIERSLWAMTDAVMNNKPEELKKHLAADFTFRGLNRDTVLQLAAKAAKLNDVENLGIAHLRAEITDGKAKVTFTATTTSVGPAQCEAEFVQRDGKWLMRTIEIYPPVGRTPLPIPLR